MSRMKKFLALLGAILSVIYLINPTAGILEIIPDNLPVIGNLDEATIVAILIGCLRYLGVDVTRWFSQRSDDKKKKEEVIDVE